MKLQDKIIQLRKAKGWTQEELAEKLSVSRQAASRWENGTALPDANNLLQLSKLFEVSADYLLNEDCVGEKNEPKQKFELTKKKKVLLCVLLFVILAMFAIHAGTNVGKDIGEFIYNITH